MRQTLRIHDESNHGDGIAENARDKKQNTHNATTEAVDNGEGSSKQHRCKEIRTLSGIYLDEMPFWVNPPNNYEYTPSMAEDGCIYLGEHVRGISFPPKGGCHKRDVTACLLAICEWLESLEMEEAETSMLPRPEEYLGLVSHPSDEYENVLPPSSKAEAEEDIGAASMGAQEHSDDVGATVEKAT